MLCEDIKIGVEKMDKSIKKLYEFHRRYDFADFDRMEQRRFTKHRSHKRVRQLLKKQKNNQIKELMGNDENQSNAAN